MNGYGNFKLPQQFLTPEGAPSQAYFDKVPMHVGETINYMTDFQVIKEMAHAFADAKSIFELAFKRTDYEAYLKEPEIVSIFGATPQKYIYDTSIYTGNPVGQQVNIPYQQAPMARTYSGLPTEQPSNVESAPDTYSSTSTVTQSPNSNTYEYPTTAQSPSTMLPNSLYDIPAKPQHQQYAGPFPDARQAVAAASRLPSVDDVYDNQGYAVDINGQFYLDENGVPQMYDSFIQRIEADDWNP